MTIKKNLTDVTRGAELTKPELTLQYIVGATFGIVVLLFVWRAGNLIFSRGSTLVQGRLTGVPTTDYKTALGIV
jgi:hypothetical protein